MTNINDRGKSVVMLIEEYMMVGNSDVNCDQCWSLLIVKIDFNGGIS